MLSFAKNLTYFDPLLLKFHNRTATLIDSAVTCLFDLVFGQKAKQKIEIRYVAK
jgi:hypothetical protein